MNKVILLAVLVSLLMPMPASARNEKREKEDSIKHAIELRKKEIADSVKRERHAEADSIRKHVTQRVFTPGYADTLFNQIEDLHTTLNNINNKSKYGFKTDKIERALPAMQINVQIVNQNLTTDSNVLNLKNLDMFSVLLKNMEVQLNEWRNTLFDDNRELIRMNAQMIGFVHDSFAQKVAADTTFAKLYLEELLTLREKWRDAKHATNANLTHISQLQADVSATYFNVIEAENKVNDELIKKELNVFGQERNYMWDANTIGAKDLASEAQQSYSGQREILEYYLQQNWLTWVWAAVISLLFFFWIFWNFRRLNATDVKQDDFEFHYVHRIPVLATLIFILNLIPFFDLHPPSTYLQILQFLLLIPLTILFWRNWPRAMFYYWIVIVVLSLLITFMDTVLVPGLTIRLFLLAISIFSAIFGILFLLRHRKDLSLPKITVPVAGIFIILNILAIPANIFGRLSLAKISTTAAILGLTEILGLAAFIETVNEAFFLQMQSSRVSEGVTSKFDYELIKKDLDRILSILAVVFWLIIFGTNLDVYNLAYSFLDTLLITPHKIGSTSFTIGNICTFTLVLYVASLLQKYIGYFFGETEDDFVRDLNKRGSRIVLFRLIIIVFGFLVAVVASGLPVDKVTVVLGALGVGIGLGLQNIVNNLISGVILIFEKPMQVGDYIEVADKKGRVQDIGIRSSKLITPEGSEVIVPNGDLLSSHMVNWTKSNTHRRVELVITIEPSTALQAAKDGIMAELKSNSFVLQDLPIEILLNNISEKSVEMTIHVWINNIYKEQEFRSEVLSKLYNSFLEKDIKIV